MNGRGAGLASACAGAAAPKAVAWWPAVLPASVDQVYVIGVRGSGDREAARRDIRLALREAIAQLYGMQPSEIMIQFSPGVCPAASFSGPADARPPAISITHDGTLSLAAICINGAVGIDVMQVREIDDWRALASDYLGAATLAEIEAVPSGQRATALAGAWTGHEARLKCHGRQLTEWTGEILPAVCYPLALPAPFVGTVATRQATR
jgi:4'-phosphopantetheinyl transferase